MGAAVHVFHEDRLFDAFFGKKVRSPERLAAHKRAAVRVVLDAVLAPDG